MRTGLIEQPQASLNELALRIGTLQPTFPTSGAGLVNCAATQRCLQLSGCHEVLARMRSSADRPPGRKENTTVLPRAAFEYSLDECTANAVIIAMSARTV